MTRPTGFAYSIAQFQQTVDDALAIARRLGASDAAAEVSEGVGLSVSVRMGELENVERNRDKSLGVTVYVGQRRGNASTSDFSRAAIEQTVRAAHDIARFTAEDPAAGLPDEADVAPARVASRDLDLFHPWAIDAEAAATLALRCEAAAMDTDRRITNSEGAAVSAQQSHFVWATRAAFAAVMPVRGTRCRWRRSLARATACSATTGTARCATPRTGAAAEAVGRYAAERALSRLGARKVAHLRSAGAVRIDAGCRPAGCLRAGDVGRIAVPQGELPRRQPGQAGAGRAPRHARGPASIARARAVRRSTTRAWPPVRVMSSLPGSCRATSCRAIRRASSA